MTQGFKDRLRLILAAMIAPVVAAINVGMFFFGRNTPVGVQDIPFFAAYGAMIGWPAMLLVGLPVHMALVKRGWTMMTLYILCGMIAGVLATIAFFAVIGDAQPWEVLTDDVFGWIGPVTGGLSAAIFWVFRRPDLIARR